MKADRKLPKMVLKVTKTGLYELIIEKHGCYMPLMKHTRFKKAYRSRSWWMHWSAVDGSCDSMDAFMSVCAGSAVLAIERTAEVGNTGERYLKSRVACRMSIEELEERGMIEHVGIKAVA